MTDASTIQELVEKFMSLPGYMKSIGAYVRAAEVGMVELALNRKPDLLQFHDNFHGGVISGLADHAAGGAVTTTLPPGRVAVTVDLHVNFIAPANGETLIAKARTIQSGRTIGVAHVDVFSTNGESESLCAVAVATLRAVEFSAV